MTRWDHNLEPERAKDWRPGDEVWVDRTLYVVHRLDDKNVVLRRHEPITIRKDLPEKLKTYGASFNG